MRIFKLRQRSKAFTLIEIIIVVAVMGILSSLTVGVYMQQMQQAKYSATQALLQMLNDGLQERLESFMSQHYAPLNRHRYLGYGTAPAAATLGTLPPPVSPLVAPSGPYVSNAAGSAETVGVKDKRSRLIARLDAMRGEFPQQFIDFMKTDYGSGVRGDRDSTGNYIGLGDLRTSTSGRSAIYMEFLRKTKVGGTPQINLAAPHTPTPANHTVETESSECLYLILTATNPEGASFDIGKVDPRFIVDSDNDGLMEFVDSWGTPLRFYRWPVDYMRYLLDVSKEMPDTMVRNLSIPDSGTSTDPYRYKYWRNPIDPDQLLTRDILTGSWFDQMRNNFESYATAQPDYGGYFRLHDVYQYLHFTASPTANLSLDEASTSLPWTCPVVPLIVSAGPDALSLSPMDRWRAFGLTWRVDPATSTEYAPRAGDLDVRCGRVGGILNNGTNTFSPDGNVLRYVGDNIVSALLRTGSS